MIALDLKPRCVDCDKLLAEAVARPWVIRCVRCKHVNTSEETRVPRSIWLQPKDLGDS